MYYRYEVETVDGWEGIFSIANPNWRRYIGRYIAEPKWYAKQENVYDIQSKCWFTQHGFDRYHRLIDEMIDDYKNYYPDVNIRILKRESLENLVMKKKFR